jgi:hypothetical protein
MCDCNLHFVTWRPAKAGEKLVTTVFRKSITRAFAAVEDPNVAVCLLSGTELAFDNNVQYDRSFNLFRKASVDHRVARYRQVNIHDRNMRHGALEFPDGQIVLVARLVLGQTATVLQLPACKHHHGSPKNEDVAERSQSLLSFRAVNRLAEQIIRECHNLNRSVRPTPGRI